MAPRNLSGRALYYMAAQMLANFVGAITVMVLARVFTQVEMGTYLQLMKIYTLFSAIVIMGLPQSLTYFHAISEERYKAATVYFVMGLLFVTGMVLGGATLLAAPFIAAYFNNDTLEGLVRNFFLYYAFTVGGAYIRRLAVVENRYGFLMCWLPFDRLLRLLSFALPALLGYGLPTVVRAAVIVAGLKFALVTAYTFWTVPLSRFHWKSGLARRMLIYSIPLGLSAAVGRISASIDSLVVAYFVEPRFFAVFELGVKGIPMVTEIAESVMTVLIPVLAALYAQKDFTQFVTVWKEAIRKTAIFVLGIFAFVEFFAVPFMLTLYGPDYRESAVYFRIAQVTLLIRVTLYGNVLQALGKTRQILYVMIVMILVKPVASVGLFLLFRSYGDDKAALGPLISSVVMAFGSYAYFMWFINGQLGMSFRRTWPWRYYGKILAAAAGAGLIASMTKLLKGEDVVARLASWLVSSVEFFTQKESIVAWCAKASTFLTTKPTIASLADLVMAGAVFVPAYVLLLYLFKALRDKDWALLRDVTYGKLVKLWRRRSPGKED